MPPKKTITLDKVRIGIGIAVALVGVLAGYIGAQRANAAEAQRQEGRLCAVETEVKDFKVWVNYHMEWGNKTHTELVQRLSRIEAKLEMLVEGN